MTCIALLHTAEVHIATFDALRDELAPRLTLQHHVAPVLLAQARDCGVADPAVIQGVEAAMRRAAEGGAAVVVCTCSTIGGLAEAMETNGQFIAMRIDRAMADEAVRRGSRIAIAAALESTLPPTLVLVMDSARRQGQEVAPTSHLCAQAWPHFEQGDMTAYHAAIADDIEALAQSGAVDVILLAQASMAGAIPLLSQRKPAALREVPVLSSPRTGFIAALTAMQGGSATP